MHAKQRGSFWGRRAISENTAFLNKIRDAVVLIGQLMGDESRIRGVGIIESSVGISIGNKDDVGVCVERSDDLLDAFYFFDIGDRAMMVYSDGS